MEDATSNRDGSYATFDASNQKQATDAQAAKKRSTSSWQWPWQSTKKNNDNNEGAANKIGGKLQVISSSKIVRRDSSVGSLARSGHGNDANE